MLPGPDEQPPPTADGRTSRRGIPRDRLSSLLEAGYPGIHDDGVVMLTPASPRAITTEVTGGRRQGRHPAERPQRPQLSP